MGTTSAGFTAVWWNTNTHSPWLCITLYGSYSTLKTTTEINNFFYFTLAFTHRFLNIFKEITIPASIYVNSITCNSFHSRENNVRQKMFITATGDNNLSARVYLGIGNEDIIFHSSPLIMPYMEEVNYLWQHDYIKPKKFKNVKK
jgi:hypothetical protein